MVEYITKHGRISEKLYRMAKYIPLIAGLIVSYAFHLTDTVAAGAALLAEIAMMRVVVVSSHRLAALRMFTYRAIVAFGFVYGVTSQQHFLLDFLLKAIAVILAAGLPAILIFVAAKTKKRFINSSIALIIADIAIFYFHVPSTPSLLFLPLATPYLRLGGIIAGVIIAISVWHLVTLLIERTMRKRVNINVVIAALTIAVLPACAPVVSKSLIPIKVSALHSHFETNSMLRQPAAQDAISQTKGDLIVTPESFSPLPPDRMSPRLMRYLTKGSQDIIVGAVTFTGEISYQAGAYHLRDGKIIGGHYKSYLFPTEGLLGAQESDSAPTDFEISGLVVRPLICFEVVRPFRQFYKPPSSADIYAVLSNTIDFPQAPRRVTRILAQTLAATSNRPVIFAANGGESVIIAANGKILAQTTSEKETSISAIL